MPASASEIIRAASALATVTSDSELQQQLQAQLQRVEKTRNSETVEPKDSLNAIAQQIDEIIEQQTEVVQTAFDAFLAQIQAVIPEKGYFKDLPHPDIPANSDHDPIYRCPAEGGCCEPSCEFYQTHGAWVRVFEEAIPLCPKTHEPLRLIE